LSLDLDQRRGWPAELRFLLERYPRTEWLAQRSADVAFWLEIHDSFRHSCVALELLASDFKEGRRSVHDFAIVAAPRLRTLVANLHGHHRTEEFHYFPVFRSHEKRLAAGFDCLEKDHAELQEDVTTALAALRELGAAASGGSPSDAALAADRYAATSSRLCRRLCRHLGDEEDLVIPLLLERDAH
jgi:iron-sulfur cluster repair protein YtfE (RIC family)